MDSRTEARVKDWDSRPFSDGYEDLRELADAEFSGAVETGSTTAFLLNGKVVGVVGGDVESFDGASGTIYEAPHPSLPLLFAMRERGGEERAKYYTNDTPISEADETLSSGSFTGYVELTENVLSGDYYVVYYGGRSMSCAFVGNQEKLITDDEAFDRADDEVGIYTVWDVDIEVQDIPADEEPDEETETGAAAGGAVGADAGSGAGAGTTGAGGTGAGGAPGAGGAADAGEGADADVGGPRDERVDGIDSTVDDATSAASGGDEADGRDPTSSGSEDAVAAPPIDDAEARDEDARATGSDDPVVSEAEPTSDQPSHRAERDERVGSEDAPSGRRARSETEASSGRNAAGRTATERTDSTTETDAPAAPSDGSTGGAMAEVPDEVMAEVEDEARASEVDDEVAWRETTTIPSINPDRTTEDDEQDPLAAGASGTTGTNSEGRSPTERDPGRTSSNSRSSRTDDRATGRQGANETRSASPNGAATGGADPERVTELSEELETAREERDRLAAERDELETERDRLAERNDELQARVDELEDEVASLERDLAAARERLETETPGDDVVELSPREALEGTNLFVRYGSKSATTLEDVHDTDVGIADLEANLRLEYHTSFDAENAVVDGKPYDEFLYESTPYQFVEWFVYDLVFEIRDTGNENDLGDLYEAFPKVDRVELYGDVSLRYEEDGEEHREQTTFDVVVRDRMGNPLAVANVNASRDPATEEMMVDLQERGTRVKRTSDALAGAFMVTASFFAPEALEIANEATSGGLLSRDSKKSYVKLSRKRGYHLCLVETRNGEFHVNVPEL